MPKDPDENRCSDARRTAEAIARQVGTVLIPVAAGVLYPLAGLVLNPMLAGAAMAFSSVSVVTNSLRLRRFRIPAAQES